MVQPYGTYIGEVLLYATLLNKKTTVGVLAFNTFGGRTEETCRWWRRQLRLTGNALSPADSALSPTARRLNSFLWHNG